jgi:hypothetical protein
MGCPRHDRLSRHPRNRTLIGAAGMFERCQKQTHAPQQLRRLFDQPVGSLLGPTGLQGTCLDGQITELLSSPLCKNISVSAYPKSNLYASPSHPTRGAYRDRHGRGAGCGGRGSVGRCQGMAGRVDKARELTNGTRTNDASRVRQSRVVLAPVAGVKSAEASRPDRV